MEKWVNGSILRVTSSGDIDVIESTQIWDEDDFYYEDEYQDENEEEDLFDKFQKFEDKYGD